MSIRNTTRGTTLASAERWAVSVNERTRGLLDRENFEDGEALVITPCNSVHMFGMRFPLDVVFVDKAGRVLRTIEGLQPRQMTRIYLRARHTIELPVGVIARTGTRPGDLLDLGEVPPGARGSSPLTLALLALVVAVVALAYSMS